MSGALARRLAAEALGTGFLVATVVGSGIMAETLTKDTGLALLGNTLPTGAILVVLITILGPISGAHFNPAVTLVFALKRDLRPQETGLYMLAQIIGGIAGTFAAHLMFGLPMLETSLKVRTGGAQWFAEWVATFGLVVTILAGLRFARSSVPWLVGLYITAAYWFTASTSFANPAVAIARSLTNTFSGIRPVDLPGFVVAQLLGAVCGLWLASWLLSDAGADETIKSERRNYDCDDLSQPELRNVPERAGDDPAERRRARRHRISENPPSRERLKALIRRWESRFARSCARKEPLMPSWGLAIRNGRTTNCSIS